MSMDKDDEFGYGLLSLAWMSCSSAFLAGYYFSSGKSPILVGFIVFIVYPIVGVIAVLFCEFLARFSLTTGKWTRGTRLIAASMCLWSLFFR